jgi:hypothetical protein
MKKLSRRVQALTIVLCTVTFVTQYCCSFPCALGNLTNPIRLVQASLVIRVFAITRFRGKKPWENCTIILQSQCAVVVWLCGARTSWSHLTSISVRRCGELASPVAVERSAFIFKAMGKRSRPNCDKNVCKCKKHRKAVTLEEKLSVIHFTRFRVTRWFLGTKWTRNTRVCCN